MTTKPQRVDKLIATHTSYSRSEVAKLIKAKLVTVDGELVTNPSQKFLSSVTIAIDGQPIQLVDECDFVIFNKPEGYVCSHEDSHNPTIYSILPDHFRQMHSVGRLDLDTSGLLFLTTDGNASHKLSSPKHHVTKTYRVWLEDPIEPEYASKIAQGIMLNGEKEATKPGEMVVIDDYCCDLTISEGKYHQVKRMFAALGNKVVQLHRYKIGNYELPDDLGEGEWLELSVSQALELIYGEQEK